MKKLLIGLSVLSLLLLSGCAPSSSLEPKAPSTKDTQSKSFKTDKKYANVYLCRNTFFGSAIREAIYVDDKFVGHTSGYSFFHWKMLPGKHTFQTKTEDAASLTLNIKPNANYFIIQEPIMGGDKLYTVDEKEGKKCVLATEMIQSRPYLSGYPEKAFKVKSTYISPVKYDKYSCKKLKSEIEKISQRAFILLSQLENINAKNSAMVVSGPLIVLPSVWTSTTEVETELGKLNGEYNALKTVARQKNCSFAYRL